MSRFKKLVSDQFQYDYRSAKTEKLRADLIRLRSIQTNGGVDDGRVRIVEYMEDDDIDFLYKMIKAMKSELSTRPNVPNKKQSKELRRKKAQGK